MKKIIRKLSSSLSPFSDRGFSLLEILIVIAIFSVLSIFISFNLFGFSQRKNMSNDADKIAFALRTAHDRAVEQEDSIQWGVHFENPTSTPQDFFVIFSGSSYSTGSSTFRAELKSSNQFLNPPAGSSTDFLFSKLYGLPSKTGSITISLISDNSVSSTITVLPQGQIDY